ncbi:MULTISPECIES: Gfo/Idh/MocA family protein [unclassified Isoptericola]|uniref:Gfo/Idh/MocA family protein n=1 Tax=unclassified Isoptericola TaxID=2623355 RepID=UPI002713934E|nr:MULTISPECIES: Gfo/Idh/MocA family oxidoreductase [unclassified Isoptericola]MDO8142947.1 Gfo/Idh/MocA family oxidoreductase [Isoptericola sp. 178]MDO8146808.1 Gfo/Idh/MocA family oxidoreductase [Isoptericola sp. b515]MDO8150878.1 Gfo/Idh/MocA family oxidoreductase [Isoptericola sp. b408]
MAAADGARLGVGMVGYSFMGAAHSHAWRTAPRFFDLPLRTEMTAVAGRNREKVTAAADRLGWGSAETDWHRLLERDDIDLVDICTPGNTHAEIAVAALDAGKHVLCEKPLANSVAEAEQMVAAADRAARRGVHAMVGFTYRRVPAIQLARQLVVDGRIGEIRHVRAQYLQDWLSDASTPLNWRLDKDKAGSGALGDIGAHVVDLTQFITGERITGVAGMLETFVPERPVATEFSGLSGTGGTETGPVTVDDAAVFFGRMSGGAMASYEATRYAVGRKNAIRIEINGSAGSLAFDFEDMNVLHFYDASEPAVTAGFRRIVVTEAEHPFVAAWWPPGHGLGYEHAFTHQVVDLVGALAAGQAPAPSFADGLAVQRVLDAVERSASDKHRWIELA